MNFPILSTSSRKARTVPGRRRFSGATTRLASRFLDRIFPTGAAFYFSTITTSGYCTWDRSRKKRSCSARLSQNSSGASPLGGRWLAYVSDESGRSEVYVQPFPSGDNRWAVSNEGGSEPAWSPNGGELFYRNGDRMMVVAVSNAPELRLGTPSVLFEGHYEIDPFGNDARNDDVSPDGRRFS